MTTDGTPPAAPRRRGRPAKSEARDDTRAAIVAAAAISFASDGFEATSMRGVARDAGVDPALVRHYFVDKAALFAEAVADPVRPGRLIESALAGPEGLIGENLVRHVVTTLDAPGASTRIVRLLHTALGQEFAARMFRNLVMREILERISSHLSDEDADRRASYVASQMIGLIVSRYGVRIEPLASADVEQVVAHIGPVVQWYLDDTSPADRVTPTA